MLGVNELGVKRDAAVIHLKIFCDSRRDKVESATVYSVTDGDSLVRGSSPCIMTRRAARQTDSSIAVQVREQECLIVELMDALIYNQDIRNSEGEEAHPSPLTFECNATAHMSQRVIAAERNAVER